MALSGAWWKGWVGLCLAGAAMAALAVPMPQAQHKAGGEAAMQARQKDVEARIEAARQRHETLQAQVSQLEQQNAERQKALQQRDAEIAALQQKLQAAGVPASAASAPASH